MKTRNIAILIGGVLVAGVFVLGPGDKPVELQISGAKMAVPHRESDEMYIYRSASETVTLETMIVTRPLIASEVDSAKCPGCIYWIAGDGLVGVFAPLEKHAALNLVYERATP